MNKPTIGNINEIIGYFLCRATECGCNVSVESNGKANSNGNISRSVDMQLHLEPGLFGH